MAQNSAIEWTTHTFNPWRGCTKVSPGCANCYAETLSGRNPKVLGKWGPNGTRVVANEAMWREPVKWNKQAEIEARFRSIQGIAIERPRVFCASLADVFEDWQEPMVDAKGDRVKVTLSGRPVPASGGLIPGDRDATMQDIRRRLFDLIDATPHLDWLLLTKRPENIAGMMPPCSRWVSLIGKRPNLWIGTSVENQPAADERILHLLRVPAAVRFLSVEPLLGPVDLSEYIRECEDACPQCGGEVGCNGDGSWKCIADRGHLMGCGWSGEDTACVCDNTPAINWVIVGGESGPGARPCNTKWIADIVDQCRAAGVACFVKQLGAEPRPSALPADVAVRFVKDKKGGDMAEWPADLRVREFPQCHS